MQPERAKEVWNAVKAGQIDKLVVLLDDIDPQDLRYEDYYEFKSGSNGRPNRIASLSELDNFEYEIKTAGITWKSMRAAALMLASNNANHRMAQILVEAGADLNQASSQYGWTPLMVATTSGSELMVKSLLDWGADADWQSYEGFTALLLAASFNIPRPNLVETLMKSVKNINHQDQSGMTALMWAARIEDLSYVLGDPHDGVVKLLLEAGARRSLRDHNGRTAADHARYENIRNAITSYSRPWRIYTALSGHSKKQRSSTTSDAAVAQCEQLEQECEAFTTQVQQAPSRKGAIRRRTVLQRKYDAAKVGNAELSVIGNLGESLEALKLEAAKLPLSEEDYLTLGARHAALMQKVESKGREFVAEDRSHLVTRLGAKLNALKALDLAPFLQAHDCDPVHVATVTAAVAAPARAAAKKAGGSLVDACGSSDLDPVLLPSTPMAQPADGSVAVPVCPTPPAAAQTGLEVVEEEPATCSVQ